MQAWRGIHKGKATNKEINYAKPIQGFFVTERGMEKKRIPQERSH
jgi:hypothetical protein